MIHFHRTFISFLFLIVCQSSLALEKIDPKSGLIIDKGITSVKQQCSLCHSTQLIIQNKANHQGWLKTIRWMQNKQGMKQLSPALEEIILDYLAKNYAPKKTGRRTLLSVKNWQSLKN